MCHFKLPHYISIASRNYEKKWHSAKRSDNFSNSEKKLGIDNMSREERMDPQSKICGGCPTFVGLLFQ